MRIYSMNCGFNMDLRDFTLLWDLEDDNDLYNDKYYIFIKNTEYKITKLTKDEIWKINHIFNEEVNTNLFGYVDFDDVISQATGRNIKKYE